MDSAARTSAVPMTFQHQGKQYIVFAIGALDNTSLVALTLPATGHIVEARPDAPYTGLMLALDVAMIRGVLEQLEAPPAPPPRAS